MRTLLGTIRTKVPEVRDRVYSSELVRCYECGRTVPVGLEIETISERGNERKILKRQFYCRDHGIQYQAKLDKY